MVEIRKININNDSGKLFELISATNEVVLPGQIKYINLDDFGHWISEQLKGFYHELYVIEDIDTRELFGFALSYDYRQYDGHCFICIYSTRDIEPILWRHFVDGLFKEYPLNKVFWNIVLSDIKNLNLASELGFSKELILKEYIYISGQYLDVCIYSISRKSGRMK